MPQAQTQAPSTRKPVVPSEGWNVADAEEQGLPYEARTSAPASLAGAPAAAPQQFSPVPQAPPPVAAPNFDDTQVMQDLAGIRAAGTQMQANATRSADLTRSAADPAQKAKPSLGRKIAGIATGIGAGLFTGNPLAGFGAYNAVSGAPERTRQRGISAEIAGLKTSDETQKQRMSAGNNLADAGVALAGARNTDYSIRLNARGQELTARGQDVQNLNSERDYAAVLAGLNPDYTLGEGQGRFSGKTNTQLAAGAPKAEPKGSLTNLSKDVMIYQGKPTDVLIDLDPESPNKGKVFLQTSEGLQDITGKTSHYEKAPTERQNSGSYMPVTDQRGAVIAWVNPVTGEKKTPEQFGLSTGDTFKSGMPMDRQTREIAAESGLRAITKFRQEMQKNPNLLRDLAIPGSLGARTALAARNELVDVLTRIRTGAALNPNEVEFYSKQAPQWIDTWLDDPSTLEFKLGQFEQQFKALAPPQKSPAAPAGGGMSNGFIKPGGALEKLMQRDTVAPQAPK